MANFKSENCKRPIGIDLFAGAGGLSLGFEQAGFDIAAAIEIDPIHCATHEYNFPKTETICASVVDITGDEIKLRANLVNVDIDVVFGGAPCQGFSLIGKRALDDPRNQLVYHFVRLVSEIKPKYFVFENVKGLTLGKHAQFLKEFISSLSDIGYQILLPYQVLNAADFGVPQSRERLFIIGARSGMPKPTYPFSILQERTSVLDAIGDLPNADDFNELKKADEIPYIWSTESIYGKIMRGQNIDNTDFSYFRKFDQNVLSSSLRTEHSEQTKNRFQETPFGKTEPVSRFRKLPPNGLCNTLRAGTDSARGAFTSARPIHPFHPRVITVREAARLHSYPDWFCFHSTKWHGFRQIGNSVPPLLGRAIAHEIIGALSLKPNKPAEEIIMGDKKLLSFGMGDAASYFNVPHDTIAQRLRKSDSNQLELLE